MVPVNLPCCALWPALILNLKVKPDRLPAQKLVTCPRNRRRRQTKQAGKFVKKPSVMEKLDGHGWTKYMPPMPTEMLTSTHWPANIVNLRHSFRPTKATTCIIRVSDVLIHY